MTGPAAPLTAGTMLAHYEVVRVLGTGGMGTVYLARDTALDREVAVKVLRPEVAGDVSLRDRFVREARAAARVAHPNLTHVYFVGEADGRPYFAMEYCPGTTLEAAIREKGPFPLEQGLAILEQAAGGLAAAHGVGVVHRDVKPSNLMVLPDGRVKVTDFGLAKSLSGDVHATAGHIQGTPTYMSPEQVRGKPVDARTDIYLLGLTAWCLFAGRPPYASDQLGEIINDQLNSPLPALDEVRPDLSPALGKAIQRMCAKDPAARPASMEEVAAMCAGLRPRPLHPAPILARGAALATDWFIIFLVISAVLLATGFAMYGPEEFEKTGKLFTHPLAGVLATAFSAALLVLTEYGLGASPGKKLFGMEIVRADGTEPSLRQILLRFPLRFPLVFDFTPEGEYQAVALTLGVLQFAAIGGGIVCYFFAAGRTLSDLVTRTRVVYRIRQGSRVLP